MQSRALAVASLAECYRNHTTTQIRIQTAGLAFGGTGMCSCHVRGVDGSCTKHLTVESYYYLFFITHSLFHSRLKTFFFCKSFPLQPFFFFFRTDNMIPQTFMVTSRSKDAIPCIGRSRAHNLTFRPPFTRKKPLWGPISMGFKNFCTKKGCNIGHAREKTTLNHRRSPIKVA